MSVLHNAVAAVVHDINAEGQDRGLEGEEAGLTTVGVGVAGLTTTIEVQVNQCSPLFLLVLLAPRGFFSFTLSTSWGSLGKS
jgi:hypothetical protein